MEWVHILAGLGIGFLGSFHCVGMCGPLALALPVHSDSRMKKIAGILLYNVGRATTYGILGAIFGALGHKIFMYSYQQALSITLGVLVLLALLGNKLLPKINSPLTPLYNRLKKAIAHLMQGDRGIGALYITGLLNGLLPCGLVYLAAASAAATMSITGGALLMFAFGLGTTPLMFSLMILGKYIGTTYRKALKKAVPVFVSVAALMLILRGLNLGIPIVSPKMEATKTEAAPMCH